MSAKINTGGYAFPLEYPHDERSQGMTLRDYFIAHAPAEPQPWFTPETTQKPKSPGSIPATINNLLSPLERVEDNSTKEWEIENREYMSALARWHNEVEKQRYIQWPAAWADAMIAQREVKHEA